MAEVFLLIGLILLAMAIYDDIAARRSFLYSCVRGKIKKYSYIEDYKQAKKHTKNVYKSKWPLWKRLLWIPLFKSEERFYNKRAELFHKIFFACGSFIEYGISFFFLVAFFVNRYFQDDVISWWWMFIAFISFIRGRILEYMQPSERDYEVYRKRGRNINKCDYKKYRKNGRKRK